MTMTDTGVKPIPAYVPPEDGKPRNAVNGEMDEADPQRPPLHGTQGKGPEGNHRWV